MNKKNAFIATAQSHEKLVLEEENSAINVIACKRYFTGGNHVSLTQI